MRWPWQREITTVQHTHAYQPISVYNPTGLHPRIMGDDTTVILMKCPCGEVETKRLDGTWTLEQLTGGEGSASNQNRSLSPEEEQQPGDTDPEEPGSGS